MNDSSLDQLLDAWVELGPNVAPARVADAARLEIRSTRQTAIPMWWPPRRFLEMNNMVRAGLVAAVVVAALLGIAYLVAPNVGSPAPSPDPSASEALTGDLGTARGALAPGTYAINDVEPFRITISVPPGWERNVVPAQVWSDTDDKAMVGFFTVDDVFADVCDEAQGWAGVGPTVDDLVDALSAVPGITVDSQTDVTISGFSGTLLDISSTDPGCPEGVDGLVLTSLPGFVDRPHPGGDDVAFNRWYILDVEGQRLVINASSPASNPEQVTEDVQSILASVRIESP